MEIKETLIYVCRRLYDCGFVTATDGNVSCRLPNGNILATPTSLSKGMVEAKDLIEIDLASNVINGNAKPSSEIKMHLLFYKERPDIHAVVHAHPSYSTGFATAGIAMDQTVFPEVLVILGSIPLSKYGTPSTTEVTDALMPYVKNYDAILLANHGVVTAGKDLIDALFKMEKVEHSAHTLYIARTLGGEKLLSHEDVDKLNDIFVKPKGGDIKNKVKY
jgi:L-fuculose-phosphate aldolase